MQPTSYTTTAATGLSPAAEELYELLSAEMQVQGEKMDANKANWPAYWNAQHAYREALDARTQLVQAADSEGFAAEQARQHNEIGNVTL